MPAMHCAVPTACTNASTDPLDWTVYGSVALFLTVIGVLATIVPALRATRTNPVEALRYE